MSRKGAASSHLPSGGPLWKNPTMPSGQTPPRNPERNWPDDDEALLEFPQPGGKATEYFAIKDAFEGIQAFGSTGSGKSSGSGKALAQAMLESNFGGLVLTAKTDERRSWQEYAEKAGRKDDLLIFGPEGNHRFNFLSYELSREGRGAGHVENLVNLFCAVLEAGDRRSGSGGNSDPYWQRALKQLLRNAIGLMVIATGKVDLPALYRIITSAPVNREQAEDTAWRKESLCYALIQKANEGASKQSEDLALIEAYWLKEFANLAIETRSSIVSMFTSMADCFMKGMLRELFCTTTDFKPEDCFSGKVILIDLPVKEFYELGIFAQALFKYIWQRAVERRIPPDLKREEAQERIRPVFLYADESQFFVNQYDALFQSTARSSRACTVYLTQNLPGYQSALGGMDGKAAAETFLGNLQTKIFHANGDPQTNNWAADSIGRGRQFQIYGGMSDAAGQPKGSSHNAGGSLVLEFVVQPQEFTMLRNGGKDNGFMVDAIIFQGGRRWNVIEDGKTVVRNFIRHGFNQIEGK